MESQLVLKGINKLKVMFHVCLCYALLFMPFKPFAQFTPGHIVVMQIGDGTSNLSGTGNVIVFKEYSTSGTSTYSVPIPTIGSQALILRGSASSEGYISLSEDANYIVFGAYAKSLPNSTNLNSAAASTINRGIGLLDASGSYSLVALAASPYANGDIRGATASNSLNLWAASSSQGSSYYGTSSSPGSIQNSKTNLRATHIYNHQLYFSSQSAAGNPSDLGIFSVGSGTPVTANQSISTVINTGVNSQAGQFYFNAAQNICYIADARSGGAGGVQKWIKTANTWSLAYSLATGTSGAGAFGVAVDFSAANPKVYATTTESVNNRLVAINDIGIGSSATTIATATGSNIIFRGLAFSPGTVLCNPVAVLTLTNNAPVCSQDSLQFNVSLVGSPPYSYLWQGQGAFSYSNTSHAVVLNSVSGNYTLTVSNACGNSTSVSTVSIYPSPTLQINAPTICAGGVASLVVTGAVNYTWSNGNNAASFTVSPNAITSYSVIGSSASGCLSYPNTTSVIVTNSLTLSVNSATVCQGGTATLNVSGASTYTWSNSSNQSNIFVSPAVTSNYTVYGSAPGCPNTTSAISNVSVYPLPIVSIAVSQTLICYQTSNVFFTVLPTGGLISGNGLNGNNFIPQMAGIGTHTITYTYSDTNLCANTATVVLRVSECIGSNEFSKSEAFNIYPNPSSGVFELEILSGQTISVYDKLGQLVLEKKFPSGKHQIDLTAFENGIYFLKLEISLGMTSSIKLLKAAN